MTVPRGARWIIAPVWLGDATMSLPTLRAIRRHQPEEPLVVFAAKGSAALYREEGSATHLVVSSGSVLEDRRRLRELAPREAWVLRVSFRAALLAWLSGVQERIGFATDHRGFLLTHRLPPPPSDTHQLRSLERLVESRGIVPDREPPRLPLSVKTRSRAQDALEAAGLGSAGALALLAPGASLSQKRWPAERFGALGAELAARGLVCAVVIGPGERELGLAVSAAAGRPLPILGEDLDPAELAALLARARVVVSNDSGAMHLAAAVGTPVVAIFGATDPRLTSPTGVPYRALDGHPAETDGKIRSQPRLDRITVDDAARAVEELLGERV